MNTCPTCHNGQLQQQFVETWMPRRDHRWAFFKNVPALVCDLCGQKTFSQEVAERLAIILRPDSGESPTNFVYAVEFDLAVIDRARFRGERPISVSGTGHSPASLPLFKVPANPVVLQKTNEKEAKYASFSSAPKEAAKL